MTQLCRVRSPNIGDKVLKRLDRIYYLASPHKSIFSITSTILLGLCLSDHEPALAIVKTNGISIDLHFIELIPAIYWTWHSRTS